VFAGPELKCTINAKMIPIETVTGIRVGDMKESSAGSEFKYNITNTL
jgi:hypothetical protein